jgi:hypothetical protein
MVGLLSASTFASDPDNQTVPEVPATPDLNPDVLTGRRQLPSGALVRQCFRRSDAWTLRRYSMHNGACTGRVPSPARADCDR